MKKLIAIGALSLFLIFSQSVWSAQVSSALGDNIAETCGTCAGNFTMNPAELKEWKMGGVSGKTDPNYRPYVRFFQKDIATGCCRVMTDGKDPRPYPYVAVFVNINNGEVTFKATRENCG